MKKKEQAGGKRAGGTLTKKKSAPRPAAAGSKGGGRGAAAKPVRKPGAIRPAPVTAKQRDERREATKRALRAKLRAAGSGATVAASAVPGQPAAPVGKKLPATPALALAQRMLKVLEDMQALEPVIVPVGDRTPMAEYFIVAAGRSTTHTRALFNAIYRAMKDDRVQLRRSEGANPALWILADYGSVVVHLFEQENRARYALDELWRDKTPLSDQD